MVFGCFYLEQRSQMQRVANATTLYIYDTTPGY